MKSFLKFVLIVAVIVLLSAFLAPLLFKILPFKFERIFNRLIMIGSLASIFIFVRFKMDWLKDYGLAWKKDSLPFFGKAFLCAWGILVLLSATKVVLGVSGWQPRDFPFLTFATRIVTDLFAGLLIGVIEEFFFRGFVFRSFLNRFKWPVVPAVIAANIFYSVVHFVSVKKPPIGPNPDFFDSLKLVAAPFASLAEWQTLWPAAVGLFIFGLILNHVVIRTGSLYPAIGLHAGAVFFIKSDALLVDSIKGTTLLFGSAKAYDGMLGWAFLIALEVLVCLLIRNSKEIKS